MNSHAPTARLFAACFGLFLVAFFPGVLSYDASFQLKEALAHEIHDWHSPVMTTLWIWLNRIYVGPAPFLVLDLAAAFTALYLLLRPAFAAWQGAIYALGAIVFLPTNFITLGTISKEGVFCSAMLLVLALAYRTQTCPASRRVLTGASAIALLLFAIAVRPDGFVAAIPIFAWLIFPWLAARAPSRSFALSSAVILGAIAAVGSLVGVRTLNHHLTHGQHSHPEQVTLYHDLAAISLGTGELLLPRETLTPHGTLETVRATYSPADCMPLIWDPHPPLRLLGPAEDAASLHAAWRREIFRHPLLYLQHRLKIFTLLLGFGEEPWTYPLSFYPWEEPPEFYFQNNAHFPPTLLVRAESTIYKLGDRLYLFRPVVFLLANLLVLGLLARRNRFQSVRAQLALVCALSGLLHLGIFFFGAPAPAVRYAVWLIFATSLSWSLYVSLCLERPSPKASTATPFRS